MALWCRVAEWIGPAIAFSSSCFEGTVKRIPVYRIEPSDAVTGMIRPGRLFFLLVDPPLPTYAIYVRTYVWTHAVNWDEEKEARDDVDKWDGKGAEDGERKR